MFFRVAKRFSILMIKPKSKRLPAIRWLMDVYINPERATKYRVFYIENFELAEQLGLDKRKSHLYSFDEILGEDKPEELLTAVSERAFKDLATEQKG